MKFIAHLILRRACICFILCWITSRGVADEENETSIDFGDVRMKVGDNLEWAQPGWDDSSWEVLEFALMPETIPSPMPIPDGIFWMRVDVTVGDEVDPLSSSTLMGQMFAASEIFWDGHLIGKNGVVGETREDEVPGLLFKWASIDDRLFTSGKHVIALRLSSNYEKSEQLPLINAFFILEDDKAIERVIGEVLPIRFMLGLLSIIGSFYFLLYFIYDKKLPYLLFGCVCLSICINELVTEWGVTNMFEFTYDQTTTVLSTFVYILSFTAFLLPWYFLSQFSIEKSRRWLSVIGGLIILSLVFGGSRELESILIVLIGVCSAAVIAVLATIKKKRGGILVLSGISIFLISIFIDTERVSLSNESLDASQPGFIIFILCLLGSLTLYMRDNREDHERALLKESKLEVTKARLESELLKSSIQPHFLMNTLNALVEWVEENPKKGVKFILEIGRHFDFLIAISGKDRVPIQQEIDLCQSFLSIMSYRTGVELKLETIGVENSDTVAPCIFHTLAENGITHNRYDAKEITFILRSERSENLKRYVFETPRGISLIENRSHRLSHGTGLKYVESRLEESYPGLWSISQEGTETSWKTIIEITQN